MSFLPIDLGLSSDQEPGVVQGDTGLRAKATQSVEELGPVTWFLA